MLNITKVKLEEIIGVKNLLSFTWRDTYGKHYSQEAIKKITSNRHDLKLLTQQANDPDIYFAVAKENGKIVGLITVRKMGENTVMMFRLYIHPDHQGKGIGSRLMQSSYEYFPTIKTIKAECEKQNSKACSFYLKKGFKIVGEKDELMEDGLERKMVEFEKEI